MKQHEFEVDKARIAASMASDMYITILETLIEKGQVILDSDSSDDDKVADLKALFNPYSEIHKATIAETE